MSYDAYFAALNGAADAARRSELETRFGAGEYLGVPPQMLEVLSRSWRQDMGFPERLTLARSLWDSGVFDAQIMAAKLLTQARIKEDAAVWDQICAWLKAAPTWAHVDALAAAGGRRISADLSRMDTVIEMTQSDAPLARRAALGLSLPLAKLAHPNAAEEAAIDAVLAWLPNAIEDTDKDVSRSADAWLKALSKHDKRRAKWVRVELEERRAPTQEGGADPA